jgi:hypothetical protein
MPTDPHAINVGLRRGRNAVFRFEPVNLLARGEEVILDRIAARSQQVAGLEAIGASVIRHHHAMKDGGFLCIGHGIFSLEVCLMTRI